MEILDLDEQVKNCLQNFEEARNDDVRLVMKVWIKYYSQHLINTSFDNWSMSLQRLYDLPSQASIIRIRAKYQNDKKKYLPTHWEVAKRRGWKREDWEWYLA